MPFLSIFPDIELTEDEQKSVAAALANPAVRKYFHKLAYDNSKFAATAMPAQGESPEEFLRKLAIVHGRIEVLETLHSFGLAN